MSKGERDGGGELGFRYKGSSSFDSYICAKV